MYLQNKGYHAICAYIDGYNDALHGGPLVGLHEWLFTGHGEWLTLPWWAMVHRRAYPQAEDLLRVLTAEEDEILRMELIRTLDEFYRKYEKDSLQQIIFDYAQWLLSSDDPNLEFLRKSFRAGHSKG